MKHLNFIVFLGLAGLSGVISDLALAAMMDGSSGETEYLVYLISFCAQLVFAMFAGVSFKAF